jgi:hypothetical protein
MKTLKKIGIGFGWTYILLGIICAIGNGCEPKKRVIVKDVSSTRYYRENSALAYAVCAIDGCEYIRYGIHGVSHKGNCTNSIHIYNVEK